jgi:hypothetical protein
MLSVCVGGGGGGGGGSVGAVVVLADGAAVEAESSSAPALRIAVATSVGTASRRGARFVGAVRRCDCDLLAARRLTVGAVVTLDDVCCQCLPHLKHVAARG